jgi:predicted oxidoreductase (fatty acid repression mutant protein)
VREAYEKATGNRWSQSDSEAYKQNNIGSVPANKIASVIETVVLRTPTKINSFRYFVKEITAQPDLRNRAWQKKRLERIVHKIRDISVGRGDYSMADFVEDVKCNCAREGVIFENDLFNELVS